MSSLTSFQVTFDNLSRMYQPGSIVSGRVIVDLSREKHTEGIFLQIYGEGKVKWTERQGKSRVQYSTHESYANMEVCLFKSDGGGSVKIPSGHHEYPFGFQLPFGVPASFQGEYGHIRYSLRAKIVRSWKFDHKIKEFFNVVPVVDLNADVNNMRPIFQEREKHFSAWCGFMKTGSAKLQIRLPKTGYVSGEVIRPIVLVDNTSTSNTIHHIQLEFLQRYDYKGSAFLNTGKIKSEERLLAMCLLGRIEGGQCKEFSDQELAIPAVVPTNLGSSGKCINVHYNVRLTCDFGMFSSKLCILSYVRIGSIPLREYAPYQPDMQPEMYPSAPADASFMYPYSGASAADVKYK